MNLNNTKKTYRICAIDRRKYAIDNLVKITFCRKNNKLFFHSEKCIGRSVYFCKECLKKNKPKDLTLISSKRLKTNLSNEELAKCHDFFEKGI